MATRHDPDWYKAWHTWALANLEVVTFLESNPENRFTDMPPPALALHAVQAIEGKFYCDAYLEIDEILAGLFHSITLRSVDALQDTLRILTLWFKFGSHPDVAQIIRVGFAKVGLDNWLEVIPQVCNDFTTIPGMSDVGQRSLLAFRHHISRSADTSTMFW